MSWVCFIETCEDAVDDRLDLVTSVVTVPCYSPFDDTLSNIDGANEKFFSYVAIIVAITETNIEVVSQKD